MKKNVTLLFLFIAISSFAQIKGTITDSKGNPMAFVNIYLQDSYTSTTSNDQGKYELNVKTTGKHIILYQYLGYKTEKKIVDAEKFPQIIDVQLNEEDIQLNDVVIDPKAMKSLEMPLQSVKKTQQKQPSIMPIFIPEEFLE
jgi:CarboxypepD_reg-like domain